MCGAKWGFRRGVLARETDRGGCLWSFDAVFERFVARAPPGCVLVSVFFEFPPGRQLVLCGGAWVGAHAREGEKRE